MRGRRLSIREGARGGYRGIDRADVHFPFGHGLGYATFELEVLEVTAGGRHRGAAPRVRSRRISSRAGHGSEPSRLLAFEKRF